MNMLSLKRSSAASARKAQCCRHQDSLASAKASKEKLEAKVAEVEAAAGVRMEQLRAEHQREVAQLQAQLRKEQQEKELLSKRLDQECCAYSSMDSL